MRTFKDTSGVSWDLRITVLAARLIRARTGIDIHNLFDERTLTALASEIEKSTDMLWAVIEYQAEKRGVSFEEFFTERCDADVFEVAIDRLLDAIVDYYPEKKAPYARKVLGILRATGQEALDLAIRQLHQYETLTPGDTSTN